MTISNWLNKIVKRADANSAIIPNGFDFSKFNLKIPIDQKDKYSITTMYHLSDNKGCVYSYEALRLVKERYPQLKVLLFGAVAPVKTLPDWYEFYHMPSAKLHNEIYNRSAIYIASSLSEGWGLTIGEAMACGAAIACTDIDGFKEMVDDDVNALLSPVKNPEAMAKNIIRLIEDDELRFRLAKAGSESIKQFRWEDSYDKFKRVIESNLD